MEPPTSVLDLLEIEALLLPGLDDVSVNNVRKMSLSVPYHPYTVCLICGSDGRAGNKTLQRCSSCKRAPYCCRQCQRLDWRVHRRECGYLKDENILAEALSEMNPAFRSATDGSALRRILVQNRRSPLLFVLNELRVLLTNSLHFWDPANPANGMAISRMDSLLALAAEEAADKPGKKINWLRLSSNLFGTVMIHRVINEQASEGFKFGANGWFESYLHNFGEVCDRIKLFAILQENNYGHFIPDEEFPLLRMKEPVTIQGSSHFPETRLKLECSDTAVRCMVCRKVLEPGPVISSHDPDRSADRNLPRLVNYLPPRPPPPSSSSFLTPSGLEKVEQRLKVWLHMVARIKTLPKEYVCDENCEQHALYGRLFNSHPLESSKDTSASCDMDDKSDN